MSHEVMLLMHLHEEQKYLILTLTQHYWVAQNSMFSFSLSISLFSHHLKFELKVSMALKNWWILSPQCWNDYKPNNQSKLIIFFQCMHYIMPNSQKQCCCSASIGTATIHAATLNFLIFAPKWDCVQMKPHAVSPIPSDWCIYLLIFDHSQVL